MTIRYLTRKRVGAILLNILLAVLGIVNIYPFFWTFSASLKSGENIFHANLNLVPDWQPPRIVGQQIGKRHLLIGFSEVLSRRWANEKGIFSIEDEKGEKVGVLGATYYDVASIQGLQMPVVLSGFTAEQGIALEQLLGEHRMQVMILEGGPYGRIDSLILAAERQRAVYVVRKTNEGAELINVLTRHAEGTVRLNSSKNTLRDITSKIIPHLVILTTEPLTPGSRYTVQADRMQDAAGNPGFKRFANYIRTWVEAEFARYFFNSVIVTVMTVGLVLIITSMAGYVLGRKRFPGRGVILAAIVGLMFIPAGYTIIPIFNLIQMLRLNDTLFAIILVMVSGNMVLNTILISGFVSTIPRDMEEAATIDGSSFFQTYYHVVLPLSKPILATVALFTFIQAWNDFFIPLVFSGGNPGIRTMSVALYNFVNTGQHSTQWELISAGAMISLVPILIIFLLLQRYFIEGVAGAIKG